MPMGVYEALSCMLVTTVPNVLCGFIYSTAWASALLIPNIGGNARALSCRNGQQV